MKGTIWSLDRDGDGIEQLKYIRERYLWSGINSIREVYSKSNSWIEFENGDMWRVASTNEVSRGIRADIALIDSRCPIEFVHCVILRTLVSSNGFAYYEFYNAKE